MKNEELRELKKRYEDLETRYLLQAEENRKSKNHLETIISSKSFRVGKAILFVPHQAKELVKGNKNKLKKALKKCYKLNSKGHIRVGIITRDGTVRPTSSAFLRLISPLTYGRAGREIQTILLPDKTKSVDKEIDVCIVQRTAVDNLGSARTLVRNLQDNSIKLVIDTDDNFGGLDPSHPQFSVHAEAVKALNYLKENADRIWVSTDELGSDFKEKRLVMRNSYDSRLWGIREHSILGGNKIKAVYMGTGTHDKDFAMVFPALEKINKEHGNVIELTVIGVSSKSLPKQEWLNFTPTNMMYPYFVKWFQKQGPFDIGFAPLENTEFNKAKSDIKVIDYLCMGVLPVVSDLKPYQGEEINDFIVKIGYGADDWLIFFDDLIKNKSKYTELKNKKQKTIKGYLSKERSTQVISEKMLEDIKNLIKK